MPNPQQIRLFWLKWIDRQYAKADPSHVKMRSEFSTGEGVIPESVPKPTPSGLIRTSSVLRVTSLNAQRFRAQRLMDKPRD
jgi:hypothetical protein